MPRKATARKTTRPPAAARTTPTKDAPTKDTPTKDTLAKDTPAKDTPADGAPRATPIRRATTAKKTPGSSSGTAAAKKAAPARRKTAAPAQPVSPDPATVAPLNSTPNTPAPEVTDPTPTSPTAGTGTGTGTPGSATSARTPEDGSRTPDGDLRATARRVLDHPGFAPELLALAAVRALGPRARDWAAWHRAAYPGATPDGLARLATRRFVRLAGAGGATAALAGLFAPVAELAAVLWAQAGLVLHLAAAYDRDPADPERAVELLVLTRVHPDAEVARVALDAARAATGPAEQPWPRVAEAAWRLAAPLAAQAGGWVGLRVASRLLPGAALVAAAASDSAAAERLAARAVTAYRPPRAR